MIGETKGFALATIAKIPISTHDEKSTRAEREFILFSLEEVFVGQDTSESWLSSFKLQVPRNAAQLDTFGLGWALTQYRSMKMVIT